MGYSLLSLAARPESLKPEGCLGLYKPNKFAEVSYLEFDLATNVNIEKTITSNFLAIQHPCHYGSRYETRPPEEVEKLLGFNIILSTHPKVMFPLKLDRAMWVPYQKLIKDQTHDGPAITETRYAGGLRFLIPNTPLFTSYAPFIIERWYMKRCLQKDTYVIKRQNKWSVIWPYKKPEEDTPRWSCPHKLRSQATGYVTSKKAAVWLKLCREAHALRHCRKNGASNTLPQFTELTTALERLSNRVKDTNAKKQT